jgi:hypothetical protein
VVAVEEGYNTPEGSTGVDGGETGQGTGEGQNPPSEPEPGTGGGGHVPSGETGGGQGGGETTPPEPHVPDVPGTGGGDPTIPTPTEPVCWTLNWSLPTSRENGGSLASGEIQTVYIVARATETEAVDWPTVVQQGDQRLTQLAGNATSHGCVDETLYYNVAVMDTHGLFSILSETAHAGD